ncbi:MAG: LTA synthase family protein [Alkalispirochaetaceae bacterium]
MGFEAYSPLILEWLLLRSSLILKLLAALLFVGVYVYGRVMLSRAMAGSTLTVQAVAAELGVATIGVSATLLLCRVHPILGGFLPLLLGLLHAANMEMVLALQTVVRLEVASYGVEKTFLRGSGLQPTFFWYGMTLIGSGALLVALWGNAPVSRAAVLAGLLAAGLLLVLLVTPLPIYGRSWSDGSLAWRSVTRTVLDRTVVPPPPAEAAEVAPLSGDPVGREAKLPKVLLLVLEGIPGAYLSQAQAATDVAYPVEMEQLSRIAEECLLFPNAVAPNQQTVRGLYSLLTGDYPHLDMSTPKAYGYLDREPSRRPRGLPEALRARGYRTLFLEAAHLDYMAKGRIMEALGFDRVLGAGYFDHSYASSGWGPDDRAFFEGALQLLETMEEEGGPWFLTFLNVGTHHPYVLPRGGAGGFRSRKLATVAYLDRSVGWFYESAKARGLLEDTLLVIVSDESHGVVGEPLGEYWPVLMAQGPGIEPGLRRYRVGQIDVAWTILSYLGLAEGSGMIARENILEQAPDRHFYFGPYVSAEPGLVYELFRNGMVREYRAPGPLYAPEHVIRPLSASESRRTLERLQREEDRPRSRAPGITVSEPLRFRRR